MQKKILKTNPTPTLQFLLDICGKSILPPKHIFLPDNHGTRWEIGARL